MKKAPSRRKPRTRFVPRAVYRTAFAGVIPLCVAGVACGGSVEVRNASNGDSGDDSANPIVPTGGVGCAAFMCASVGAIAFDAGEDATLIPFVAAIGFDASQPYDGPGGVADASFRPDPDAATQDAPADTSDEGPTFFVADAGFAGG